MGGAIDEPRASSVPDLMDLPLNLHEKRNGLKKLWNNYQALYADMPLEGYNYRISHLWGYLRGWTASYRDIIVDWSWKCEEGEKKNPTFTKVSTALFFVPKKLVLTNQERSKLNFFFPSSFPFVNVITFTPCLWNK